MHGISTQNLGYVGLCMMAWGEGGDEGLSTSVSTWSESCHQFFSFAYAWVSSHFHPFSLTHFCLLITHLVSQRAYCPDPKVLSFALWLSRGLECKSYVQGYCFFLLISFPSSLFPSQFTTTNFWVLFRLYHCTWLLRRSWEWRRENIEQIREEGSETRPVCATNQLCDPGQVLLSGSVVPARNQRRHCPCW